MLRQFLREVGKNWVALVTGIASFVLGFVGVIFPTFVPAWIIWPVTYICLVIASYQVWKRKHEAYLAERVARELAEAQLAGAGLDAERERQAGVELARLLPADNEFLKRLLVTGHVPNWEQQQSQVNFALLERAGFISRDFTGYWSINPLFRPVLSRLLGVQSPGEAH
jgi:hypothetical protein